MTINADRTLLKAGVLLGIGMGGFLDGIVFHQIFQVHNMLSNRYFPDSVANIEINMVWDGLFHLFTWVTTAAGIALLWQYGNQTQEKLKSTTLLLGPMALGWGLFNLVEGVINHHILSVHHVVERAVGEAQLFWDLLLDASGVTLMALGLFLIRRGVSRSMSQPLTSKSAH